MKDVPGTVEVDSNCHAKQAGSVTRPLFTDVAVCRHVVHMQHAFLTCGNRAMMMMMMMRQ
jgi:hypothetical protein